MCTPEIVYAAIWANAITTMVVVTLMFIYLNGGRR